MKDEQVSQNLDSSKPPEQETESLLRTFEHPINCDKIEYSPEPLPSNMRLFNEEEVKQVVAGDNHTVVLTAKGRVYTWGMGSHG